MNYTQVRITKAYRDKLATLADQEHRSMARQLEVLIDQAIKGKRSSRIPLQHEANSSS